MTEVTEVTIVTLVTVVTVVTVVTKQLSTPNNLNQPTYLLNNCDSSDSSEEEKTFFPQQKS